MLILNDVLNFQFSSHQSYLLSCYLANRLFFFFRGEEVYCFFGSSPKVILLHFHIQRFAT